MAVRPDRRGDRLTPLRLTVRVTPRGGRDAVEGWTPDADGRPMLKVRVAAAASDGAANAAVVALIASKLGLSKSQVRLVAGATARIKRLEVDGLSEAELARVFGAL
jgi:hypothetical protein